MTFPWPIVPNRDRTWPYYAIKITVHYHNITVIFHDLTMYNDLTMTLPKQPYHESSHDFTLTRVSSKQTKIDFGSNRSKPKQDLFPVCFNVFRENNNKKFRFVLVFRTYIETTETNRTCS